MNKFGQLGTNSGHFRVCQIGKPEQQVITYYIGAEGANLKQKMWSPSVSEVFATSD